MSLLLDTIVTSEARKYESEKTVLKSQSLGRGLTQLYD